VRAVLVISGSDNVATALEPLEVGRRIDVGGHPFAVRQPIPHGHKVALRDIPAGAPVVKFGSPIGTADTDISAGDHVHVHNVSSTRGRGDLAAPADPGSPAQPRLAEPPE
jgi:altronate dehydratase